MLETVIFKKFVDSLWPAITNKASLTKKLKNLNVENAFLSASNVEKVKTIWQVDKEVRLHEFYYPTKIKVDDDQVIVEGLKTFPENGKIVLQGTAGQGKSILLRFITSTELKTGKSLPIFVELRKISPKKSLIELILDNLKELGLDIDFSELDALLATGKCTLLLDAFDEIPENEVSDVITTLDSFCNQHHNLPVIITSRPNAEIQKSAFFHVYDICPLTPSDFEPLLKKLFTEKSESVNEILKAIHNSESQVVKIVKTPLLLTLLVIIYKSYSDIPSNLAEFYEKLFFILCFRHDSTKPGFKREFATGLTESELSKLFDAFCFYCMKSKLSSLTLEQAISMANDAADLAEINISSPEDFLKDITKVTCLMVEEGFEYHFIHKSIREYHAAHYIKEHAQDQLKINFYSHAGKASADYLQELSFLSSMDHFRYKKYFLVPHISSFLNRLKYDYKANKTSLTVDEIVGDIFSLIHGNGVAGYAVFENHILNNNVFDFYSKTCSLVLQLAEDEDLTELKDNLEAELGADNNRHIHLSEVLAHINKQEEFLTLFNQELKYLNSLKTEAEAYIEEKERKVNEIAF